MAPARTSFHGTLNTPRSTRLSLLAVRRTRQLAATSTAPTSISCLGHGQSWRTSCASHHWLLSLAPANSPRVHRRRYAYDAIHNTISQARSEIERGGYSRVSCPFVHNFLFPPRLTARPFSRCVTWPRRPSGKCSMRTTTPRTCSRCTGPSSGRRTRRISQSSAHPGSSG